MHLDHTQTDKPQKQLQFPELLQEANYEVRLKTFATLCKEK